MEEHTTQSPFTIDNVDDNVEIMVMHGNNFQTYTKEECVVMELCKGGSLYSILEKPKHYFGLPEMEVLAVLTCLGMYVVRVAECVLICVDMHVSPCRNVDASVMCITLGCILHLHEFINILYL